MDAEAPLFVPTYVRERVRNIGTDVSLMTPGAAVESGHDAGQSRLVYYVCTYFVHVTSGRLRVLSHVSTYA